MRQGSGKIQQSYPACILASSTFLRHEDETAIFEAFLMHSGCAGSKRRQSKSDICEFLVFGSAFEPEGKFPGSHSDLVLKCPDKQHDGAPPQNRL